MVRALACPWRAADVAPLALLAGTGSGWRFDASRPEPEYRARPGLEETYHSAQPEQSLIRAVGRIALKFGKVDCRRYPDLR